MDTLTPAARSEQMSHVHGRDTRPELEVRRLVYAMGFRYRLHVKDLPGKPDIVFRRRRSVIFVNGCFWHRHEGCRLARMPKSKVDFWKEKLEGNAARDRRHIASLRQMGWRAFTVWEFELKDKERLAGRLRRFIEGMTDDDALC